MRFIPQIVYFMNNDSKNGILVFETYIDNLHSVMCLYSIESRLPTPKKMVPNKTIPKQFQLKLNH